MVLVVVVDVEEVEVLLDEVVVDVGAVAAVAISNGSGVAGKSLRMVGST